MLIKNEISSMKLDVKGFNECPDRGEVFTIIRDMKLDVEFVDLDKSYWQNGYDTMVFKLQYLDIELALNFAEMIYKLNADEFDKISVNGCTVFRLWWD